jgi:hypothetical protein
MAPILFCLLVGARYAIKTPINDAVCRRHELNVSEFLHLDGNIGYYMRSEFLPQSWNNGIVVF